MNFVQFIHFLWKPKAEILAEIKSAEEGIFNGSKGIL
jgi:hypothetical protein